MRVYFLFALSVGMVAGWVPITFDNPKYSVTLASKVFNPDKADVRENFRLLFWLV
jgi:hypothetical protein